MARNNRNKNKKNTSSINANNKNNSNNNNNKSSTSASVICSICMNPDSMGKYKCPVDATPYCSVVCFKKHKSESCSKQDKDTSLAPDTANASSDVKPTTESQPSPSELQTPLEHPPQVQPQPELKTRKRLKRLKDLEWPELPNTEPWTDPLRRDEPKPLRHSELEAIATSPQIRSLLHQNPTLINLLSRLHATTPVEKKEYTLRKFLDLDHVPQPTITGLDATGRRRNNNISSSKSYNHHNNHRSSSSSFFSLPNPNSNNQLVLMADESEKSLVQTFANLVSSILQQTRDPNQLSSSSPV